MKGVDGRVVKVVTVMSRFPYTHTRTHTHTHTCNMHTHTHARPQLWHLPYPAPEDDKEAGADLKLGELL